MRCRGGRERQGRTRRSISNGYLSAALRLHHASGADRFHFHFSLGMHRNENLWPKPKLNFFVFLKTLGTDRVGVLWQAFLFAAAAVSLSYSAYCWGCLAFKWHIKAVMLNVFAETPPQDSLIEHSLQKAILLSLSNTFKYLHTADILPKAPGHRVTARCHTPLFSLAFNSLHQRPNVAFFAIFARIYSVTKYLVHPYFSVNFHQVRCAACLFWQSGALRNRYVGLLYVCRMVEHDAAIQLNFAPRRQEVKRQNNNVTSGYFSK